MLNMNSTSTLIVLPVCNPGSSLQERLDKVVEIGKDLLLIDDGSTDGSCRLVENYDSVIAIRHELPLGIGVSIIRGYEYARDMGYNFMISLDSSHDDFGTDVARILENLSYGYDIINCSRILENYDHARVSTQHLDVVSTLSSRLMDITGFDITDPLSVIKGMRIEGLKSMELSDFGHGVSLQLFIQSRYFGLNVIEIPASSGNGFAVELDQYNDPVGHFLSLMETERNLYPRTSTN